MLKKTAAVGIDGVTWQDYAHDLEAKLIDLHGRIHRGSYQAKPPRRVYILKPDGDIEGFFNTIDHEWFIKFLKHRSGDRRILRLIFKWLRAGIIEDNDAPETKMGTPQAARDMSQVAKTD